MSTHGVLSTTSDYALSLLKLLAVTAGVFPPLQSAASSALRTAEIVKSFRANNKKWEDFGAYVQNVTATIGDSLAQTNTTHTDIKTNLEKLRKTLDDTVRKVQSERAQPRRTRMYRFMRDPDMIKAMRKELNDVISLFQLSTMVKTDADAEMTLGAVMTNTMTLNEIAQTTANIAANTMAISHNASQIALNATLEKLRYVQGASWDTYRVCLPNTRINITSQVLAWINQAAVADETKLLLLTAVAGAGKSTIAHTIAKLCYEKRQLVSSFFFDQETEGRNSPAVLFNTIAADLSRINRDIAKRVTSTIESDRGLPYAPLSRQFEELILRPIQQCPAQGPLVIVIDGLDQGWDDDMLSIFRDRVSELPGTLRIFLTSRMRPELDSLRRKPHVRSLSLDIDGPENLKDIGAFVAHRLERVAIERNLGSDWPGEQRRKAFETKSDGLFLWVSTVCDYLCSRNDPTHELNKLLSEANLSATTTELQMDKLYTRILESCNWEDEGFVCDYHRIMGTTIAAKTPLTVSAMNILFHDEPVASSYTLQQLSPLLTGTSKEEHDGQPVRLLHQSFRDFIVVRAGDSPDYPKRQIVERKHSENLALLCLRIMNRSLSDEMNGAGYLAKDEFDVPGIPTINDGTMSEALRYACQSWTDHVVEADSPLRDTLEGEFVSFMRNNFIAWMEVTAARGSLRGVTKVREWAQIKLSTKSILEIRRLHEQHADAYTALSIRLKYEDRREETLIAAEEAVTLCRQLAKFHPSAYLPKLAGSLHNVSSCFSDLGRREEALAAIEQAVVIYRQLAGYCPDPFIHGLAGSLQNLSVRLSDLGRREDALAAIEEAEKMYRQLATNHPAAFAPDLVMSLHNLSNILSDLGRREEALAIMEQAVGMCQQLVADYPNNFAPDLAMSLHNLSNHLSGLGRWEQALKVIEEAVKMYREMAAERPAAFTPDLAMSLHNLSNCLSGLGRHEEALTTIEEVVKVYLQLAAGRSATFTPSLAIALHSHSNCLSHLGRQQEALVVIEMVVEMNQQLAADCPAAFTPNFAGSLRSHSDRLSDLRRQEEALVVIKQAVGMCRQLSADCPAAFNPDLAVSLHSFSNRLSDLGRREEALVAMQEAVMVYRPLAANYPAVFSVELSESLSGLSNLGGQIESHPAASALN